MAPAAPPAPEPVSETPATPEAAAEKNAEVTAASVETSDEKPKSGATGDAPVNSTVLLVVIALFSLLFIAAIVLTGLSGADIIKPRLGASDFSPRAFNANDKSFNTLPFTVPFTYLLGAFSAGILGIVVLTIYAFDVLRKDVGTPRMVEIAGFIAEGSIAFLRTEYTFLSGLVLLLFVLLGFAQNWASAGCYAIGALLSALTGYIGMSIATRGNVRTTAACIKGVSEGLNVAFRSGAVMGLSVVAIGLAGLSFCYLVFRDVRALAGFSAGASTIALFARVGGGIYTKAADVGADLVGKVEANIPEDDPRNPATIADNVGDNVGDVAGMGSDLFESYVGSIVATSILGSSLPYFENNAQALCVYNHLQIDQVCPTFDANGPVSVAAQICNAGFVNTGKYPTLTVWQSNSLFIALPFMLALVGILVSIVCTAYVYVSKKLATETDRSKIMESLLGSLRINIYSASVLVLICSIGLCWGMFGGNSSFQKQNGFGNGNLLIVRQLPKDSTGNFMCNRNPQGLPDTVEVRSSYHPLDSLNYLFPSPQQVPWRLFLCIVIGLLLGNLIGALTEYFTAGNFSPTKGIAKAGEYGAGAVVIQGLGVGMLSTILPICLVVTSIVGSYNLFGTYGIALAAVGMLSTLGVTMATDAYGPVADNAGGIAEMAELDSSVRDTTDALDALGNTTAATGKGFANGSGALTAFALLTAVVQESGLSPNPRSLIPATAGGAPPASISSSRVISLVDIYVVISLFIGIALPYLFGAFTMLAVSRAAQAMIVEVRRQFREIPGLREGLAGVRPNHIRCINISTRSSLMEMVLPGTVAIMAPLIIGFGFGQRALVALLVAAIGSGYMLGILMSNAGGAWDNSKKLVESGFFGEGNGKGSEWHKATVAGDTVGDPFKDTSGPSMNILIKLMSTFGLVTVALMNPGLDDPSVRTGWIGIILLVVTLVVSICFAVYSARMNSKTRAEAARKEGEDAPLLEKEGVEKVDEKKVEV